MTCRIATTEGSQERQPTDMNDRVPRDCGLPAVACNLFKNGYQLCRIISSEVHRQSPPESLGDRSGGSKVPSSLKKDGTHLRRIKETACKIGCVMTLTIDLADPSHDTDPYQSITQPATLGKIITDSVIRKIDGWRTGAGSHSRYLIYSILARQYSSEQSLSLDHTSVLQDQDFLDFVQGPLNSNLVSVDPKPISLNLSPRPPSVWQVRS